jgi:hypothetical protein
MEAHIIRSSFPEWFRWRISHHISRLSHVTAERTQPLMSTDKAALLFPALTVRPLSDSSLIVCLVRNNELYPKVMEAPTISDLHGITSNLHDSGAP